MEKIRVAIIGVCGRMGSVLAPLILAQPDMELVGGVEAVGHPQVGMPLGSGLIYSDLESVMNNVDTLIEFTNPSASLTHLGECGMRNAGIRYILGTTGFSQSEMEKIKDLSTKIPIVYAPNFSVGVNLLFSLTELVSKRLDNNYDIEILEIHHRKKSDAPSGTAKRLAEIIQKTKGTKKIIYGREGFTGEKRKDEIGVLSIRSGDVVGEHYVIFGQEGERIELVHKATSRLAFAQGVLKAIRFLKDKGPGFYSMTDVLEF